MNNKGFAITGIIYTLFILFLMILLTVLSGLSSHQRLLINSLENLEVSFMGDKIEASELISIKNNGVAPYYGKYIFNIILGDGSTIDGCYTYLEAGVSFDNNIMTFSPKECNNNPVSIELIEIYKFKGDN